MLSGPVKHGRGERLTLIFLALALVGARLAREAFGASDDAFAGKPRSYKIKIEGKA